VLLGLLLMFYSLMACVLAFKVDPPSSPSMLKNPDEESHFAVVTYMADHHAFPPYDRLHMESIHPPFYYAIAAVLYASIKPIASEEATLRTLRLLSVAFGIVTVLACYWAAGAIWSDAKPLFAASITALLPAYLFLTPAVSNDGLVVMLSTLALGTMLYGLRDGFTRRLALTASLLVVLAVFTKYSALPLVPLLIASFWFSRREGDKNWLKYSSFAVLLLFCVTGWWFYRNVVLFGDPLRSAAEARLLSHLAGINAGSNKLEYVADVLHTTVPTFFGDFHHWAPQSVSEWLPDLTVRLFELFCALCGIGIVGLLMRGPRRFMRQVTSLLLAYAALVTATYLAYNMKHYNPHARLLFPALFCFSAGSSAGIGYFFQGRRFTYLATAIIALMSVFDIWLVAIAP
jgi:4-amino-4-deoxy-L-arabinose transferase-like glycosyltransferase